MNSDQEYPTEKITADKIDELLAFMPVFDDPAFEPIVEWRHPGGLPYPVYAEPVKAFYRIIENPPWHDHRYSPKDAQEMLNDEKAIAQADIPAIRSMLSYCHRGERFCDGHRGAMVREGKVVALLQRLAALRG